MKVKITMKDNEARRFLHGGHLEVPARSGTFPDARPPRHASLAVPRGVIARMKQRAMGKKP